MFTKFLRQRYPDFIEFNPPILPNLFNILVNIIFPPAIRSACDKRQDTNNCFFVQRRWESMRIEGTKLSLGIIHTFMILKFLPGYRRWILSDHSPLWNFIKNKIGIFLYVVGWRLKVRNSFVYTWKKALTFSAWGKNTCFKYEHPHLGSKLLWEKP